MSLAVAFLMPFVMMAVVFLLARIEDRHLTTRPRALAPSGAETDGAARPEIV